MKKVQNSEYKLDVEPGSGRMMRYTAIGVFFACVSVIVLGLVVIIGWYTGQSRLVQIFSEFVPMQFNTALLFILTSLACVFQLKQRVDAAGVVASLVVCFAGVTLFQYIADINLGLDELFFKSTITGCTSHPGRMAPNTAVCFILASFSVWIGLGRCRLSESLSSILAAVTCGLGLISLIGYIFGVEPLYAWGGWTQMAIHTSVGFVILGGGWLFLIVYQSRTKLEVLPQWFPVVVFILSLSMVISLRQAYSMAEADFSEAQTVNELEWVSSRFIDEFRDENYALKLTVEKLMADGKIDDDEWKMEAGLLVSILEDFDRLSVVRMEGRHFKIERTYPDIPGTKEAIKEDLIKARLRDYIGQPHDTDAIEVVDLFEPGEQPDFRLLYNFRGQNQARCFFWVELNLPVVLDFVFKRAQENYWVTLVIEGKMIYTSMPEDAVRDKNSITRTISVGNREWQIELLPKHDVLNGVNRIASHVIFGAGLVISLLISIALHQGMRAFRKSIEARQLLYQSQQQWENAIIKAPIPVSIYDETGLIYQKSEVWEKLCSQQQIQNNMVDWLSESHALDEANQEEISFPQLMTFSGQIRLTSRTGKPLFWSVYTGRLPDPFAGKDMFMMMANDVTDMRQIQIELERSNEELDKFAYVASHDLKSPLRAIQHISNWIKEDCEDVLPQKSKEDLMLLVERTGRMENLLDSLLQYSRIGDKKVRNSWIDVGELISSLLNTLAVPEGFTVVVEENMPTLEAPEAVLNLIFGNFISNAVKHHDKALGRIDISHCRVSQGYKFCVQDDGPGIESQHQQKIFEMFQTLKSRDTVEGSGMGLALVKKAVEKYGGTVFVESEPNKGTRMCFIWPFRSHNL